MRYYTLAEGTPSIRTYGHEFRRRYRNPVSGFLFHDTEKKLPIHDCLRALFRLSDRFEEACAAYLVKVDPKTVFASFSTSGFPVPTSERRLGLYNYSSVREFVDEYLKTTKVEGAFIGDIKDPNSIQYFTYNDLYDDCIELMRHTDMCPCEKITTDCIDQNVVPKLTVLRRREDLDHDHPMFDSAVFKNKAYSEIAGFTYVSSAKTTVFDFAPGMRPWDYHDFTLVKQRTQDLSDRAKKRHLVVRKRKQLCSNCAFSYHEGPTLKDCGWVSQCEGGVTQDQAWSAVWDWYSRHSDFTDMPGFTSVQRDYLIAMAGTGIRTTALTGNRKVKALLGGFFKNGVWEYRLSPQGGDLTRSAFFNNYSELQAAVPDVLPKNVTEKDIPRPVNDSIRLACAVQGQISHVSGSWGSTKIKRAIVVRHGYVEGQYVTTRYDSHDVCLSTENLTQHDLHQYGRVIWYGRYHLLRTDVLSSLTA